LPVPGYQPLNPGKTQPHFDRIIASYPTCHQRVLKSIFLTVLTIK
jgi:hypothetical protein